MDEQRRLARNIAEVIDDLYRPNAAFRDHERRIDLIVHQIEHAMTLAVERYVTGQSDRRQSGCEC
jgi:hypothetical protein